MSSNDDRAASLKGAILRGVFEHNRGIVAPRRRRTARASRSRAKAILAGLILAALLAFPSVIPNLASPLSREVRPAPTASATLPQQERAADARTAPSPWSPEEFARTVAREASQNWVLDVTDPDAGRPADYGLVLEQGDVRLTSLFGLAVQTIVIDPGHGGRDPGAIGALGTREKDVTLDIALRLRDRLRKAGNYRVVLTREVDRTVTLSKRVEFVNEQKADLFVSIHINSLPQKPLNVIETYYFGLPSDDDTLQLAEQENQGSDYPLGGFREIIQKIEDTLKRQESAALAASIQRSLFTHIREYDTDVRDLGVKVAPFVVLLGVDAPAVLTEISCITHEEEEVKLNSRDYREQIASFLQEGIVGYVNRKRVHAKGEDPDEQEIDG